MKEINLIPENVAFDYKKFLAIRISAFLIVINIVVLMLISSVNVYVNGALKQKLSEKAVYLKKLDAINNKFSIYKSRYVKLKSKLSKLKSSIYYYKSLVILHKSAFADSVVFLNTFSNGVWFSSVSYSNGYFDIAGKALSKSEFQNFYNDLQNNKYITDLRFFYIKRQNDKYNFKINYRIKLGDVEG